jgi:hypothetical protein
LLSSELRENCKLQQQDFTRNRSLTFTNLTVFIINFVKKSLQLELYSFADFFNISSVSKQAFSKARKKLSPMVFTLLNRKLLEEFYTDNEFKTFKGFRVLAIDGSTLRLPHNVELYDFYGSDYHESSVPLAKISTIFDVLNHITLHSLIRNNIASERDMAADHIKYLSQINAPNQPFEDLLIFDRGYPSLGLLFTLKTEKKHFLARIQKSFFCETNAAIQSGSHDSIITISLSGKKIQKNIPLNECLFNLSPDETIQIRLLILDLPNGQKEYIITSLMDQEKFKSSDVFFLYGLRWNIEENYKIYKNIAEIENFSGKSKIAIEQDFYATIFSCNISSLVMLEAQEEVEIELKKDQSEKMPKYQYKVNRNILIGTIKNEIMDVLLSDQDLGEYCEKLKNRIKKNLIPIVPGRQFPRIFKKRRSKIDRKAL